jgi:hypothetical protein
MQIDSHSSLSGLDHVVVMRLYNAFANNPDLLDGMNTEDWHDSPLASGQVCEGSTLSSVSACNAALANARTIDRLTIGVGEKTSAPSKTTRRDTGEWLVIHPIGRAFVMRIHLVRHIENGSVRKTWHLEDWFGCMHQIGVLVSGQEEAA